MSSKPHLVMYNMYLEEDDKCDLWGPKVNRNFVQLKLEGQNHQTGGGGEGRGGEGGRGEEKEGEERGRMEREVRGVRGRMERRGGREKGGGRLVRKERKESDCERERIQFFFCLFVFEKVILTLENDTFSPKESVISPSKKW